MTKFAKFFIFWILIWFYIIGVIIGVFVTTIFLGMHLGYGAMVSFWQNIFNAKIEEEVQDV